MRYNIQDVIGMAYIAVCMSVMWVYGYHVVFTIMNIWHVSHSGMAFYLAMGVIFPPLGFFNGILLLLV